MAKKKTFEDNMNRLEEILSSLENSETKMTEIIKLYKEGLDLVVGCSDEINAFEQQVTELKIKAEESLQN